MRVSNLIAAAGAAFILSAGAALAAEGCECCKDMAAADAEMKCCDEMKPAPGASAPEPEGTQQGAGSPTPAPAPQN